LLSSHLIEDVERLADRVAFLGEGRILMEGGAEEVRGRARRLVVGPVAPDEALADLPGRPLVRRQGREAVLTYLRDGPEAARAIRAGKRFAQVTEDGVNLEQLFVGLLGEGGKEATACGA
jgi:ABC-2 type transport system ATP-binding protein